ncbi:capsid protein [Peromfec virus RodF5_38]|uniref:Capsid protein n=1 Tax=Peromfec virus RodF5_38 TaxID=2929281 RepID=A0A976N2E7_9VIRU|nr:capsid protein [Peromfec virus RodF5_38]
MAYRRRAPAKRGYKAAAKKRYAGRSKYRRSYAKRRTYRKPAMTKKRILDVSSRKKRNGMLGWTNTGSTSGASIPLGIGSATVAGNMTGLFMFCPTAMNLLQGPSNPNYAINAAERTATTCYMRGFAENLRIQTNTHIPWFHRRICFTWRGLGPFNTINSADTPTQPYAPFTDTSNGMQRLMLNMQVNNMSATVAAQWVYIFKGAVNVDWNDVVAAPVDTARVDLKFDKTWLIKSSNESGTIVERKLWHPMNKNLVYDDDEIGESMTTSYYSVDSKQGMGDYYIYDIFQAGLGGSTTDLINISPNSTMYWHEK